MQAEGALGVPDRPQRRSARHSLGEAASRFGLLGAWAA